MSVFGSNGFGIFGMNGKPLRVASSMHIQDREIIAWVTGSCATMNSAGWVPPGIPPGAVAN
ncbi:hypothetical protein [Sediminicoccus sp. BL-A-41-H5]|uniref:hypothetical protein n=1 Tax=Sediminicoccus sp. BL-A-41-H5 TaxID=3421106 RepID=UPI003D6774C2